MPLPRVLAALLVLGRCAALPSCASTSDDSLSETEAATVARQVKEQVDSLFAIAGRKDANAFAQILAADGGGVLISNADPVPAERVLDLYRAAWSNGGRQEFADVGVEILPLTPGSALSVVQATVTDVDSAGVRSPGTRETMLFAWVLQNGAWRMHSGQQHVVPKP